MEWNLAHLFEELNRRHFGGELALPLLRWNARLRTSAGRFIPGGRWLFSAKPPVIDIASYLQNEAEALQLVTDTLGHEMIHYWLWCKKKPYGHTAEFMRKMREMGVSRYNPVPKRRAFKYFYVCKSCQKEFPARKKLGRSLACADCCKRYSGGKYDARFRLELSRKADK